MRAAARHWLLQVAIALDQLVNALLGGWADETLSSRAWRTEAKGRPWGRLLRPLIDALLWFDPQHCRASFESERQQRQHPPEARAVPHAAPASPPATPQP